MDERVELCNKFFIIIDYNVRLTIYLQFPKFECSIFCFFYKIQQLSLTVIFCNFTQQVM